jgi:hypothetical protein
MSLGLDQRSEGVAGRLYDLDLSDEGRLLQTVASFFVTQAGYPIRYGTSDGEKLQVAGALGTAEKVTEYVLSLMSAPDSPLTVALAYQLRKREVSE